MFRIRKIYNHSICKCGRLDNIKEAKKINIKVFRDFLSHDDLDIIENKILEPKWSCNHFSKDNTNLFWKMDNLEQDEFFSTYLLNKIKNLTGEDFNLERVYFNGHNACSQGFPHIDSDQENGRTFLIYCNRSWDLSFGGNTSFIVNDQVKSFFPYPRSGLYFQNNILHTASPISKFFTGVRVTLAFKLFLKKS
jgi:hypothetical protein